MSMVWTKTPPSKPGWYWERMPSGQVRCALLQETSVPLNEIAEGWLWSSEPIPEPSEPPEHPDIQELRKHADALEKDASFQNPAMWRAVATKASDLRLLADKLQAALSAKDAQ